VNKKQAEKRIPKHRALGSFSVWILKGKYFVNHYTCTLSRLPVRSGCTLRLKPASQLQLAPDLETERVEHEGTADILSVHEKKLKVEALKRKITDSLNKCRVE
jgi:hypothetical protein